MIDRKEIRRMNEEGATVISEATCKREVKTSPGGKILFRGRRYLWAQGIFSRGVRYYRLFTEKEYRLIMGDLREVV